MLPELRLDAEMNWRLTAAFLPPCPPVVVDGRRLIDLLLAPPREQEGAGAALAEPEAEEMAQSPDRFSEQDYRDADRLLEGVQPLGSLVSDLLHQAGLAGHSQTVKTLLYLLALRDFGEPVDTVEYAVEAADRCFLVDPFWGDDLLIRPSEQLPEERA